MYVESWKVGYWPNSVENKLIEVTDQTQHELPVNQIWPKAVLEQVCQHRSDVGTENLW